MALEGRCAPREARARCVSTPVFNDFFASAPLFFIAFFSVSFCIYSFVPLCMYLPFVSFLFPFLFPFLRPSVYTLPFVQKIPKFAAGGHQLLQTEITDFITPKWTGSKKTQISFLARFLPSSRSIMFVQRGRRQNWRYPLSKCNVNFTENRQITAKNQSALAKQQKVSFSCLYPFLSCIVLLIVSPFYLYRRLFCTSTFSFFASAA